MPAFPLSRPSNPKGVSVTTTASPPVRPPAVSPGGRPLPRCRARCHLPASRRGPATLGLSAKYCTVYDVTNSVTRSGLRVELAPPPWWRGGLRHPINRSGRPLWSWRLGCRDRLITSLLTRPVPSGPLSSSSRHRYGWSASMTLQRALQAQSSQMPVGPLTPLAAPGVLLLRSQSAFTVK